MDGFPDFLIVGAPKCGTTSLAHYLADHDEIFIPAEEEPHFYSYIGEKAPHWGYGDVDEYLQLYQNATQGQVVGERSTWYLYSDTAARQIKKYAPDTKCIAILRHPIDRAYSHWSFRTQNGWETLSFGEAIAEEEKRITDDAIWDVHYLNVGRYYEQLLRFYRQLGSDRVQVLWFEELKDDSSLVVQKALSFLGLEPEATMDTNTVHNETRFPKSQWLNRVVQSNVVRRAARSLIPTFARSILHDTFQRLNRKERPSLDPEYRKKLTSRIRPDVERLQQLLDTDLSRWMEPSKH